MSGHIFQNVILQLKENTDRTVGVIDGEGTVVACSELALIGQKWDVHADFTRLAEGGVTVADGKCFKALGSWGGPYDYLVFVSGEDEISRTVCALSTTSLNTTKFFYEEKHDRGALIKSILAENILASDIYSRARELGVTADCRRIVLLVRPLRGADDSYLEKVQSLFPDRQNDFVVSIGEGDIVLVHQVSDDAESRDVYQAAQRLETELSPDNEENVIIGIGTVTEHLRDIVRSYKEAGIAIDVGKVFDTGKHIVNYENLGIGRLIYQLPTPLCGMFLQEVFKKNPIDSLDNETLFTIHRFFENNLNVSETARKLFVHRNTLVYRLEKIKKLTGLDLREFDDAITFKVALMVKKYLTSRGMDA